MKKKAVRGLTKLTNGRGPFVGKTKVGKHVMQVLCGKDNSLDEWLDGQKTHEHMGEAPNAVILSRVRPSIAWSMSFQSPEQAEMMARILEALGQISEEQAEALGFVEGRCDLAGN